MRMRTVLLAALALGTIGVHPLASGQSPSSTRPANGLVVGQVIDARTGKGITGAVVVLSRVNDTLAVEPSDSPARSVLATGDGRYVFRQLGGGRYTIGASKPGYVAGGLGARRPGGMRQLLMLADGERVSVSAITMWKHAAISGVVVDDGGEPVTGARVRALRRTPLRGREFGGESSTTTDDRGLYRLAQLPPGDYLVVVASIAVEGSLLHPITFHPSTQSPQQAAIVTVAAGDDRMGVDFQLPLASGVRVAGTVQGPNGPVPGVLVRLRWPDADLFPFDLDVAATASGPDGGFSFTAVSEGTYVLETVEPPRLAGPSSSSSDPALTGTATFVINDRDIDGLLLPLRPGARVSGRVTFEGGITPTTALVAATSVYLDRLDARLSRVEPARPGPLGQFTTTSLPAGKYRVRVGAIPAGWMFNGAMYEGHDLADEPFELESTDITGVVVTFTTRVTRLSGAVRSERGRPDPDTSVVIFPTLQSAWTPTISIFRMRSVRTSTLGSYTVTNLPPGEYYVAAVPEDQFSGWQDPKRLAELALQATRIRVVEGQTQVQDLRTVRSR
jgi:Carboxypeptidase regulatory-like domain